MGRLKMKIGYLDDQYVISSSARRSMKKYDLDLIDLQMVKDVSDINELVQIIMDNRITCLLVDYDLMQLESKMYGTQIIKELNEKLPDFTCFLLTNYIEQGVNENLVQKIFVQDKVIFAEEDDSDAFVIFIEKIKNSIECFEKRLNITKIEYDELFNKRKQEKLSAINEERFFNLYKILSAYGIIDELPEILLRNSTQDTLNDMMETLKSFKDKLRKE